MGTRPTALLALVIVLALTAAAATSAAPTTQRRVYTPFAADGSLRAGLHAVDYDGECFTSSLLVGRVGVFRCFTGNLLRDPCFRDPSVAADRSFPVVVCATDPWRHTVVRIHLAKELPTDPPAPAGGSPWGLELVNGARCVFVTGATSVVDGHRLNYVCGRDRFLWGSPRTSSPTWRIRQSRAADGRRMRLVAIGRAWR
jgi:hypothetical protein